MDVLSGPCITHGFGVEGRGASKIFVRDPKGQTIMETGVDDFWLEASPLKPT
jgi:hypothetical protein